MKASTSRAWVFLLCLAACSLFVWKAAAQAGPYYVCYDATECNAGAGSGWSTGSPSNDGLSKSTPLQCPGDLHGVLAQGVTGIVGDGNYTQTRCELSAEGQIMRFTSLNGTSAQPVIVKAENKYGAVIDGEETVQDAASRSRKLIFFEWSSYIQLEGFEMKQAYSGIELYAGRENSFITFKDLKMHDFGFVAISTQITDHDITIDSTISYDIWDDSGYDENGTCVHQHNLYLNGYNLTVINNVMYSDWGGTALTVGGFCNIDGDEEDPAGFTHTLHAINNTIDGNGCVVTYSEPTSGDKRFNTIDFYNRVLNSGAYCDAVYGGAKKRNFKNVAFENNLFLNGQTALAPNSEKAQAIGNTNAETVVTPPSCLDFPWLSCSCVSLPIGSAGYLRFNNNVAETFIQNPTHQAWANQYIDNCDECTGINVEDEAAHDYMPTASSTALLGKGSPVNAPSYDILGTSRPQGSIDIGAYQYSQ